jgi:hypothetical protein
MIHNTTIIAAGWIEWVGPLVVFILYVLGQLMTAKDKKPPQPQQREPRPRGVVAPPQQPRTLEEKLRSEVEQFLRQVQGEQPNTGQTKRPTVVTKRPLVVKVEQLSPSALELEPPHESVQEHVSKHMSTADITQHAATLGVEVGHADEKLQAHLQEKFQHQVGALEPRQQRAEPQRRQNKAAAEIAALLRSPTGMRQAIIASEILRRPEF